jgi:hypothetical protein
MRRLLLLLTLSTVIAGCAMDRNRNSSEREWARAECNNIIDREARQKCLRRVDDDYGGSQDEKPKDPKGSKR